MTTQMSRRGVLKAGALAAGTLVAPGVLVGSTGQPRAHAADPITLTMLDTTGPESLHVWETMTRAFDHTHPGLRLQVNLVPWANYDQKVDLLLAAGTPPTLWWASGNNGFRYYAARNYFPPIDAEVARDHYDLSDYERFPLEILRWKGHLIGLPSDVKTSFLVYNKTLFDKARLPYPPTEWADRSWDYDKFLEYAKALTVRQGGKTVQWGTDGAYTDSRFPFQIFGGDIFAPQSYTSGYPTARDITLHTPEVIDGFQFIRDLVLKWKVQPTPAEAQAVQAGAPSLFQTGKIAMEATAGWSLVGYSTIKNFEWGIAALPWPPKRYGVPRNIGFYANQWMVFKGQKYPELAWELQKWMAGPEAERLYSQVLVTMSTRKSLRGVFKARLKALASSLTTAEVDCVVKALGYCRWNLADAVINWSPIEAQATDPVFQKMMLGQLTGKQAVAEMITGVNAALKQYPAPH